jgi:hypothetical protein
MMKKMALTLAMGFGLLVASSKQASAQRVVVGVAVPPAVVVVPPAYVEIGPPPGPGYVWIPSFHRWGYRPYYYRPAPRFYRRWR